ncbi:hypothetical protein J3R30DRAFT_3703700 [Lentinula aciculospora]|uniref:Uncharacterized protein n=1 Tax=Lentinula aciculospora TaxID=153920 RepID=A0A9W9A904_9AGAR|nr:hypothetical protein J3R30DRAFT_3703700 [Lentinula aciculospora]
MSFTTKLVIPVELIHSIVDICAEEDTPIDLLKTLTLVSPCLCPHARKRLWEHLFLPPKRAIWLAQEEKDYSDVVDGLAAVEGLSTLAKYLHLNPYPPGILSHFLHKLHFVRVEHVYIQGYNARAPAATPPGALAHFLSQNLDLQTLELSSVRINAVELFGLLSQSRLRTLRLNYLRISSGDDEDEHPQDVAWDAVSDLLLSRNGRIERPSLQVLDLNTVYIRSNFPFTYAFFTHPNSLFDILSLRKLTLHISQSTNQTLNNFANVIDLCCHSVQTLIIYGWQDVTLSDSCLLGKFQSVNQVELVIHGSGHGSANLLHAQPPGFSLSLAFQQLSGLVCLRKLTIRLRFHVDAMTILNDSLTGMLVTLSSQLPDIQEISVVVDGFTSYSVFSWDQDTGTLLQETGSQHAERPLDLLQMLRNARYRTCA